MSAGGLDPDPPDPGAAPFDVAAIRARARPRELAETAREALDHAGGLRAVAVQQRIDAVAKLLEPVCGDIRNLCNALERERKIAAAWKALADARVPVGEESWAPPAYHYAAEKEAKDALRSIGIDPEAP